MQNDHVILGVHLTDRVKKSVDVQKVFTEHGCSIKSRIGLHDVGEGSCAPGGIILIEFFGAEAEAQEMAEKLNAIEGVCTKMMVFGH